MNINTNHLFLIVLFILVVCIPVTFAADNNDTQLQDNIYDNSMAVQDTVINTQTDPITDDIAEDTSNDDNEVYSEKQSINYDNSKNKNIKKDEIKTRLSQNRDPYQVNRMDNVYLDVRVFDEDYNQIPQGKVSIRVDDTLINTIDVTSTDSYTFDTDNITVGEHTVYLNYSDETGVYSPCENSFKLIKYYSNPISIYVEPFYSPIVSSMDLITLNVEFQDYDAMWVNRGNVSLSFYVNDTLIPVVSKEVIANEEYTPIVIDMDTITSIYPTEYPLTVQYKLEYTDLTEYYENTIKEGSFSIYKLSDNIVEIPYVEIMNGENLIIPYTIKDADGEEITEGYSIDSITMSYNRNVSFTVLNDSVLITYTYYPYYSEALLWLINYENGESSVVESYFTVLPPKTTVIEKPSNREFYKNIQNMYIPIHVYDPYESYNSYYNGIVTIYVDGNQVGQVDLSIDDNNYVLSLYDISIGKHNITLTYYDDSGEYPNAETSFIINRLDTLRPVYMSGHYDTIVYKNQESLYINLDVYTEYEDDEYGTITDYLYEGITTISVDGEEIVEVDLSEYTYYYLNLDDISAGNHNITLNYTDGYVNLTSSFTLTKVDMIESAVSVSSYYRMLSTDEYVEINYEVYDQVTRDTITIGNVTFLININDEYIPLKTDVNNGKIRIALTDILNNYETVDYPLYVSAILTYNDTTGQYTNYSSDIDLSIYKASGYTVEIPDMEDKIPKTITIPVIVRDENGIIVDPDEYRVSVIIDNYYNDIITDGSNVILDTERVYAKTYTLHWFIYLNNGNVTANTSTLKLNPHVNPGGIREVNRDTESISFDLEVYDYCDYMDIHYIPGQMTIYMDDEIVDSFYFNGYDDYSLDVGSLSIGEHTALFVYNNDETNITCNSTMTIIKSGLTEPNLYIIKSPNTISIVEDQTLEWEYQVIDDYEDVTCGTVTLYVLDENAEYIPLKTVDVTEKITINIDELTALYTNTEYPIYVNYYLKYNGYEDKYTENTVYGSISLTNLKKSNINYEKYEVCDEGTKIFIKVTDSENNTITKGTIKLTLEILDEYYNYDYSTDKEYSAADDYILIQDLKLDEKIGFHISLSYEYIDETGEYSGSSNSNGFQMRIPLTFNVDDHITLTKNYNTTFTFNLTDQNGNIVNRTNGYINVFLIESDSWVESIYNLENPEILFLNNYECGDYQIVLEYNDEEPYFYNVLNNKTVTVTLTALEKTSNIHLVSDVEVCANDYGTGINWEITNEYNNTIYGKVSVYLDDELLTTTYDSYYYIETGELNIGNHIIKLIYTDESAEYPSCETTGNLYKSDLLSCYFTLQEYPQKVSTNEENISISYDLKINGIDVEIGTVSLYLKDINDEDSEAIFIKSVNVTDHIITVPMEDITTKFGDNYPYNLRIILNYTDETNTYANCSDFYYMMELTNKKVALLNYTGYTVEDGKTIIYYTLKDKENNNISQGLVKLTQIDIDTYYDYDISVNATEGKIIVENLDLSEYPGYYTYIFLRYDDTEDVYEHDEFVGGFQNTLELEVTATNVTGKISEYIPIPVTVTYKNQSMVNEGYFELYHRLNEVESMQIYDFYYDDSTQTLNVKFNEMGMLNIRICYSIDNPQYNSYQGYTQITVTVYDENQMPTNIQLEDITGLTDTQILITVNVYDFEQNPINEGTVTFTDENGNILGESTVTDGVASITYTSKEELTTQITAHFTPESDNLTESESTSTLTIQKPTAILTIDDVTLIPEENVTLTARVTDQFGNNINKGKVIFKINGKTVKDASGKVIYAKVIDGVATINYYVSKNLIGKEVNITAVYEGTTIYNKQTATIITTVEKTTTPSFKITPITQEITANTTITLKAKATDGNKAITTGKVIFKINGKTVKDASGKVIYAKLDSNGEVSVDYNIGNLKAKTYNITAVLVSSDYDKLEDNTNLTVV